jgi:hypothetical protein
MARPKMTEEQKAAAKAAREAAKAGADRAEARSAKNRKSEPAKVNSDDLDQEERVLFLNHLPIIRKLKEAAEKAGDKLKEAYAAAKAEAGFTKADFDTAFAVETAENEARERAAIARKLKIAKIMGSALGNQLDMFLEPDRTPIEDRAYAEGEQASAENRAAKPPYDPSTVAFRCYMEGFHNHQATLAKGIKPTNPTVKEDIAATAAQKANGDQQRAQDAASFDAPRPESGTAMTRAEFKKQQAERAEAGGGKFN